MTPDDLPQLVRLALVAAALVGALGAVAAGTVKVYKVVRAVDEHFKSRESDRIEAAASRLIDQAAGVIGNRLDGLADQIRADRQQRLEDRRQGTELVAEWEMWRAGIDARLDQLEEHRRTARLAGRRDVDRA